MGDPGGAAGAGAVLRDDFYRHWPSGANDFRG